MDQKGLFCKNDFLVANGISIQRVQRLFTLLAQGKSSKNIRGKMSSANTISGKICGKIK